MSDARPVPRSGWVYILTNPAYGGLVKIGHTARDPETRAAELSTTGVPARFAVAWAHQVTDHEALEGIAHGRLARYRVNDNREFFNCSVAQARRIIEQEARALLLPWWRTWLHRLAHPLPSPSRRSAPPWRRRSREADYTPALVLVGLAVGYLVLRPPAWLPPGLVHLVRQLPGLH